MVEITKKTNNIEVFKKLLNSVAKKYDCGVTFSVDQGRLHFDGDQDCANQIMKETAEMLDQSPKSE